MNAERRRWGVFVAVAGAVVLASLLPVPPGGSGRFLLGVGLDKWAHGVGYAAVAFTFARARVSAASRSWRGASSAAPGVVLGAIVVGFTVGAGVELLQTLVATRTASFADAGTNAVGAALGALVWRLRRWRSVDPA